MWSKNAKHILKVVGVVFGVLPIEEGLGAPIVKPNIIIQVQIVSIPMAWINLRNTRRKLTYCYPFSYGSKLFIT